jgi:DNA polymerase-3 subunit gamma/tau
MQDQEPYIVSARKYRPQTFDTVVGQAHITTTLKNAIRTSHLAHAYLFCGPRGVGKTTCARILARAINCEQPTPDMEACGQCATCLSFKDNTSFNIFELDAASNNSVDDIRRLTEQVRYAPQHGRYKIYIIDEVHMLSTAAFNAFLKTLEEPPAYAIFILATTEKHKILPTILSRCQIFDFKRIQTEDIVAHLASICRKENMESDEEALHIIAQKSEGCMRDALSMMDRIAGFASGKLSYAQVVEHLNILDASVYFRLSENLWAKDIGAALLFLDEILQKGFEGDLILNGFAAHFRNLLLSRDPRMAKLIDLPEAHRQSYYQHAQIVPEAYILSALSLLNDAELSYKNALNKRLHIELCLIRLCYLNDMTLPSEMAKPEGLKKKLIPPTPLPETKLARPEKTMPVPEQNSPAPTPSVVSEPEPSDRQHAGPEPDPLMPSPKKETAAQQAAVPQIPLKPKLSRNLSSLHEHNKNKVAAAPRLALDQELAEKLFVEFKARLREKDLLTAEQMEWMQLRFASAEEIQLICTSGINQEYGKSGGALFREYCKEKTGTTNLRVRTIIEERNQAEPIREKVLSRQEVYELMAGQNPALKMLKEALNLHVEF